jgi:STE24 endopeptidase
MKQGKNINSRWTALVALSALLGLIYLWFSVFPGEFPEDTWRYFTADEAAKGRSYQQVRQVLFMLQVFAQGSLLVYLLVSGKAQNIGRRCEGKAGRWGGIAVWIVLLALSQQLISLPFSYFGGYVWPRLWGLSAQTLSSWLSDYGIWAVLETFLTLLGGMLFFALMERWPKYWWLAGSAGLSLWLVLQSYLWPLAVAPLFNHFEPVQDPALVEMVEDLAAKANLRIDQIFMMDASRQTNTANAYFAGLGNSKQVVLYDNLIRQYPQEEIQAVVAHELAHWSQGHIVKGLGLGSAGIFVVGYGLAVFLRSRRMPGKARAGIWVEALLFFLCISLLSRPLENSFSRRIEAEADRVAVAYTQNIPAAIRLHRALAVKNLADVAPPPFIRWLDNTHPPTVERLKRLEALKP